MPKRLFNLPRKPVAGDVVSVHADRDSALAAITRRADWRHLKLYTVRLNETIAVTIVTCPS